MADLKYIQIVAM